MLSVQLSHEDRRKLLRRGVAGQIPYAAAVALGFLSPYISIAICGAVAVYYAFPAANTIRA
jgi:hypothetical protein